MRRPRPPRTRVLLPLVLLMGAIAGCSQGPPVHRGFNVIFILADTLRADHLASYGYQRQTSPFLDRLAQSKIRFSHARSQAACTFPSVNSILTSRNVFNFHEAATRPGIPEGIPSLAEILSGHGYRTQAVSASPIVRRTPSEHNPRGGFGRGFDDFDESCLWYQSTCVTSVALDRLEELEAPFFLYLHYMDPHDPYIAIAKHRGLFADPYEGEHPFIAAGDPNPIEGLIRRGEAGEVLGPEDFQHLIDLYDEEIFSLDFGLAKLFDGLAERRLLERSLVVVASDHGEAFFEHGRVKHCYTVYENETRVPLVMSLPRAAKPLAVEAPVQNLDIVPTLLDYLGIDAAPYGLEGRSLRPLIESRDSPPGDAAPRLAFSAMGAYRSVNDERHKLVLNFAEKRHGLYDLAADPAENDDLSADRRETYYRLLRELKTWSDAVESGSDAQRLERAREIEEELRAVGYLGG